MIHGQVAADGELGYAVDEGPGGEGVGHWVAGGQVAGLLRGDDAVDEDAEGFFACVGWGTVRVWRCGSRRGSGSGIEHDGEVVGPPEGELDVAAAGQDEAVGGGLGALLAGTHGYGEALEALDGYSGQEIVLAGEVAVGGVVGDAGAAGYFAEGECAGTGFAYERHGGIEEGLTEIEAVVGLVKIGGHK